MRKAFRRSVPVVFLFAAASGCAGTQVPDRTLFVGEVAHVLSRDEIMTGNLPVTVDNRGKEPLKLGWLKQSLIDQGMKEEDLVQGRIALSRHQYYWHNTGSGIVRQFFRTVTVPKGLTVEVGNIVEIETLKGYGSVRNVRYKTKADGNCIYRRSDNSSFKEIMGVLTMVGPNGAASLYCPDLEKEGWTPQRYRYGIDWQKAPTSP